MRYYSTVVDKLTDSENNGFTNIEPFANCFAQTNLPTNSNTLRARSFFVALRYVNHSCSIARTLASLTLGLWRRHRRHAPFLRTKAIYFLLCSSLSFLTFLAGYDELLWRTSSLKQNIDGAIHFSESLGDGDRSRRLADGPATGALEPCILYLVTSPGAATATAPVSLDRTIDPTEIHSPRIGLRSVCAFAFPPTLRLDGSTNPGALSNRES